MQIEAGVGSFDYKNVKQGDCVVAFSRRAIYEVKAAIEKCTGLRYDLSLPDTANLKVPSISSYNWQIASKKLADDCICWGSESCNSAIKLQKPSSLAIIFDVFVFGMAIRESGSTASRSKLLIRLGYDAMWI